MCQVRLRPVDDLASSIDPRVSAWYNWTFDSTGSPELSWPVNGIFVTTCSCDALNPTGQPSGLSVTQSYDHMMFKYVMMPRMMS